MFGTATTIYGAGGNDTVSLADSATTALFLLDGGDGDDVLGKTTVTFTKALSGSQVLGGAGADTIKLKDGGSKLTVDGGAGADVITLVTGITLSQINGGAGADVINYVGGTGDFTQIATINGGAGADTINISEMGTNADANLFTQTACQANIQYGSGDVIKILSGSTIITATFTGINVGLALPSVFIMSSLSQLSAAANAAAVSAFYGVTSDGNIAVFDTDGQGATDGDLIIAFNDGGGGTKFSHLRILGGDELILTTKTGKQAAALVGITFSTDSDKEEIIMTLA